MSLHSDNRSLNADGLNAIDSSNDQQIDNFSNNSESLIKTSSNISLNKSIDTAINDEKEQTNEHLNPVLSRISGLNVNCSDFIPSNDIETNIDRENSKTDFDLKENASSNNTCNQDANQKGKKRIIYTRVRLLIVANPKYFFHDLYN